MAKITSEYDLDEGIPEEITEEIEDSTALEAFIDLGSDLMDKYNMNEKLTAGFLIQAVRSNFSE